KPLTYKPCSDVNGPEGRPRQSNRSPCFLHSAEPFQAGGSKGGRQSPFSSERSERLLRSAGQSGARGREPPPPISPTPEPEGRTRSKDSCHASEGVSGGASPPAERSDYPQLPGHQRSNRPTPPPIAA